MFPYQIPSNKDVKTMVVVIDLIYPRVFDPISPFMVLNTREGWTSLSRMRVVRVPL